MNYYMFCRGNAVDGQDRGTLQVMDITMINLYVSHPYVILSILTIFIFDKKYWFVSKWYHIRYNISLRHVLF